MTQTPHSLAWKPALILALLVILAYVPAWPGSFLWDDDAALILNPHIHEADGLKRIWFSTESIEYYPIYYTSLRAQWRLFGERPTGYSIVNLALHILNALLFWLILIRLKVPRPYWAACFFALHPAAVHAVAWINQHKTVLSTSFYLLSALLFLFHLRYRRPYTLCIAFVAFVAGLLTKPTLVFLPFALMAIARIENRASARQVCVWLAPWLVMAAAVGVLRLFWMPPPVYDWAPMRAGEGWLPWAVAGCSVWYSAFKILLPVNLSMIYPRWPIDVWNVLALLPFAFLLIALSTLWRYRDRHPNLWIGGFFYGLALLPVSGLFDNTYFTYSFVANHWWYPALFGLIPMVTTGLNRLLYPCSDPSSPHWPDEQVLEGGAPRRRNAGLQSLPLHWLGRWSDAKPCATLIPIICVLLLLFLTALEARRFHDPLHFYTRGIAEHPDNVVAHQNLANLLREQGDPDAALIHYLEAIRIHPVFWQARVLAGQRFSQRGDFKEAFDQFWAAHDIQPRDPIIHFHLGVLYGQAHQPEKAVAHLSRSVALNPSDAAAWNNLGTAYFHMGQMKEAVHAFEQALALNPDYEQAARNLAHTRDQAP